MSCVGLQVRQTNLRPRAKDIDETRAMSEIAERHEAWERRIAEEASDVWSFVVALSDEDGWRCWQVASR